MYIFFIDVNIILQKKFYTFKGIKNYLQNYTLKKIKLCTFRFYTNWTLILRISDLKRTVPSWKIRINGSISQKTIEKYFNFC